MQKRYKKLSVLLFIILGSVVGLWYVFQNKVKESGNEINCKGCNLIMISLSNVSAEHMSSYGYKRLTTPRLDTWAKDAIVFQNTFAQTSWTLPVATSLFTSLYPYSHKIMDRFVDNVLNEKIQTLPEILRNQGYKTAAYVGGLDYNNKFGHMRGFEEFEEAADFPTAITFAGFKPTLAKALGWLAKNSKEKFFLFVHGYDTHCPFDPPEHLKGVFSGREGKNITVDNKLCLRGFKNSKGAYEAYHYRAGEAMQKVILTQDDIQYLEDLYDEEILSVDEMVGNFLDALDKTISKNTVIVIFSDHGEMFAKHGRFGRAGGVRGTLYDDVVHVPLMMKIPSQKGTMVDGLVEMIDVMPTLLHILNLPESKQIQGKNLAPLVEGEKKDIHTFVFAGAKFGLQQGRPSWFIYRSQSISESVRTREWKLIHEITYDEQGKLEEDAYELYNLKNDPDELLNLAQVQSDRTLELKGVLRNWKDAVAGYDVQNISSPQLLPKEIIEQGREHGYW